MKKINKFLVIIFATIAQFLFAGDPVDSIDASSRLLRLKKDLVDKAMENYKNASLELVRLRKSYDQLKDTLESQPQLQASSELFERPIKKELQKLQDKLEKYDVDNSDAFDYISTVADSLKKDLQKAKQETDSSEVKGVLEEQLSILEKLEDHNKSFKSDSLEFKKTLDKNIEELKSRSLREEFQKEIQSEVQKKEQEVDQPGGGPDGGTPGGSTPEQVKTALQDSAKLIGKENLTAADIKKVLAKTHPDKFSGEESKKYQDKMEELYQIESDMRDKLMDGDTDAVEIAQQKLKFKLSEIAGDLDVKISGIPDVKVEIQQLESKFQAKISQNKLEELKNVVNNKNATSDELKSKFDAVLDDLETKLESGKLLQKYPSDKLSPELRDKLDSKIKSLQDYVDQLQAHQDNLTDMSFFDTIIDRIKEFFGFDTARGNAYNHIQNMPDTPTIDTQKLDDLVKQAGDNLQKLRDSVRRLGGEHYFQTEDGDWKKVSKDGDGDEYQTEDADQEISEKLNARDGTPDPDFFPA